MPLTRPRTHATWEVAATIPAAADHVTLEALS